MHPQKRYIWIYDLIISVVPSISNCRAPKIIFCARPTPGSDTFEEWFCTESRGCIQRQIVKHCIKEMQVLREEEHDDLMLDVIGLFGPLSYTPTAESKYQREDKAPRLEYDFVPASTGVNDLFDDFFMDKKGSGLSDSGQKNDGDEWNEDAERCVKIAEKDTLVSMDQNEWKMLCRVSLNLTSGSRPITSSSTTDRPQAAFLFHCVLPHFGVYVV